MSTWQTLMHVLMIVMHFLLSRTKGAAEGKARRHLPKISGGGALLTDLEQRDEICWPQQLNIMIYYYTLDADILLRSKIFRIYSVPTAKKIDELLEKNFWFKNGIDSYLNYDIQFDGLLTPFLVDQLGLNYTMVTTINYVLKNNPMLRHRANVGLMELRYIKHG